MNCNNILLYTLSPYDREEGTRKRKINSYSNGHSRSHHSECALEEGGIRSGKRDGDARLAVGREHFGGCSRQQVDLQQHPLCPSISYVFFHGLHLTLPLKILPVRRSQSVFECLASKRGTFRFELSPILFFPFRRFIVEPCSPLLPFLFLFFFLSILFFSISFSFSNISASFHGEVLSLFSPLLFLFFFFLRKISFGDKR